MRPTHVEVDCAALRHNLAVLRSQTRPGTKLMAVIKANAYGHGIIGVAKALEQTEPDFIGVAVPEEGISLREAGIKAPILVLGGILEEAAPMLVEYDLDATVFSLPVLHALEKEAMDKGKIAPIHIKLDTGMNRIGLKTEEELIALLDALQQCNAVKLSGLFTHFAVSEIPDKSFTLQQNERFQNAARIAKEKGFSPLLHAANSGATLELAPETAYDMVRTGYSLYGYAPGGINTWGLKPALTWKTAIVHKKTIMPGDTVSYGRRYTAEEERIVATLPVGYGDGYHRCMSGKAQVLISGKRAPVVGAICMDQIIIDITNIPEAEIGDEVILLGKSGEDALDADELAGWANTIGYEILLSISARVPRVYKNMDGDA